MSTDKPEQSENVTPKAEGTDPYETGKDEDLGASKADDHTHEIDPLEALETQNELEAEIKEARDATLRAQADAINAQRRAELEIEKARKFALERFCGELLGVVDNLERALDSSGDDSTSSALFEGVELTRKSFIDLLSYHCRAYTHTSSYIGS